AGISGTVEMITDGYGNDRSAFEKYLIQELEDIDGTVTREGENPASLENAESLTSQSQFIDPTSLEIVKTHIESNASYSDTLTGSTWYWQGATDWVPRDSETGLLPHGNTYIGKKLVEGSRGTVLEGGIESGLLVREGGLYRLASPVAASEKRRLKSYFMRSKARATLRWFKHMLTFANWLPYIVRKVERHSGKEIQLTTLEKKLPIVFLWPRAIQVLFTRREKGVDGEG
ncbi:MAG: hypothetical protein VYB55_04240, partial [Bacteroidota bacterium]|nr:hypothetical protein [Bacteroidota bacterium]